MYQRGAEHYNLYKNSLKQLLHDTCPLCSFSSNGDITPSTYFNTTPESSELTLPRGKCAVFRLKPLKLLNFLPSTLYKDPKHSRLFTYI